MRWRKVVGWDKWFATENGKHVITLLRGEYGWCVWVDRGFGFQKVRVTRIIPTNLKEWKCLAEMAYRQLITESEVAE